MAEIIYWSASRIAAAIAAGELSCREVVQTCLQRIEAVNPRINAVVQLQGERALDEAKRYDRMSAQGQRAGPLHGVPITLKDSIDTSDMITTGGTMGRKNHVPEKDAPVAARLRQAGAIIIGKTNTPELTFSGETNNIIYGRTRNPFDLERSPGGSSGGSAAIIASGGAFLELGSDTGGSIREPAHLCGIAGIKPTAGRVPRSGHIVSYGGGAMDALTQIGPMARYVQDLGLALPLIAGPDGEDPYVYPVPLGDPSEIAPRQLRIAWYADNGLTPPHADIARVVTEVATGLAAAGFNLVECRFPDMERLVTLSTALRQSANVGLLTRLLEKFNTPIPGGPDLQGYFFAPGPARHDCIDAKLLEDIDLARSRALQFMADYDAILCPPSHTIARPHRASHNDTFNDWSYITVQNLLGWPCGTVRAGTSTEGALPVGVQVVAAPWRDDIVLALMAAIEQHFGGYQPPVI